MTRLTFLMSIFALTALLSGCGQSGPLYIPGNPSQMAVPPSQETSGDEQQEEDDADSSESD